MFSRNKQCNPVTISSLSNVGKQKECNDLLCYTVSLANKTFNINTSFPTNKVMITQIFNERNIDL